MKAPFRNILKHLAVAAAAGHVFAFGSLLQAQTVAESVSAISGIDASEGQIQAARAVWKKYVEALKTDDTAKMGKAWNREEAKRNAYFDGRFNSFSKYRSTVKLLSDQIIDARSLGSDIVRMTVVWRRPPEDKPVFEETVFAIWENGKPVLARALTAMTRDWSKRETRFLVYKFDRDHVFNSRQAAAMDSFVQRLCGFFKLKPEPKIPYYIFPPKSDSTQWKSWGVFASDAGEGMNRLNIILERKQGTEYSPHEAVHILQRRLTRNTPCLFLLEGTAVYFGGDDVPNDTLFSALKRNLSNPQMPTVDSLLNWSYSKGGLSRAREQWLRAVGAASVGYLFETFGAEPFRQFYIEASADRHAGNRSLDYAQALDKAFKLKPTDLNQKLRTWVADRANP